MISSQNEKETNSNTLIGGLNEEFIYIDETSSNAFSNPCSSNSQSNFDVLTTKLDKGKGPGRTKLPLIKFDFKLKNNSKPRDELEMFLKEIILDEKKVAKILDNKETIQVLDLKSFSHYQNSYKPSSDFVRENILLYPT